MTYLELRATRKGVHSATGSFTIGVGVGAVVNVLVYVRERLVQDFHLRQALGSDPTPCSKNDLLAGDGSGQGKYPAKACY